MSHVFKGFQGLATTEVQLFQEKLKGLGGLGVEIGCLDGYSTMIILDASDLKLVSIDPLVPDSMEKSLIGKLENFRHNTAKFGDRAFLVQNYSHVANKTWFGGMLDFVFIDGDHTEGAVEQDFNDWTRFLKVGGLLAIHDARMGRPGGANFHVGPSAVAKRRIFDKPQEWEVVGEAFSLVIARRLA